MLYRFQRIIPFVTLEKIKIDDTYTVIYKNVANCLLTKIPKMQILKFSGRDVSILAGPFSKAVCNIFVYHFKNSFYCNLKLDVLLTLQRKILRILQELWQNNLFFM